MKIDLLKKTLAMFAILLCFQTASAQDVVDYVSWLPSSPYCNLFYTATNVPTTSGPDPYLTHTSTIGQPHWNSSNLSIEMKNEVVSGAYYGTQYQIAYNSKAGAKYYITVNAAAQYSSGATYYPLLITDLTGSGGSSVGCSGTGFVDPYLQGETKNLIL